MGMRGLLLAALVALVAVAVVVACGQQAGDQDVTAAQVVVERFWAALAAGDAEGVVACVQFPLTTAETSPEDVPCLVESQTEEALRAALANAPKAGAPLRLVLQEVRADKSGRQLVSMSYRLPPGLAPWTDPAQPSERLLTVLAKVEGEWRIICTALPM